MRFTRRLEALLTELGYAHEVVSSVPTKWMPDGMSDTVRYADYLLAKPVMPGKVT